MSGLLAPTAATADERFAQLGQPGTVAIMRHALAPGGGDPDDFVLGDCSTQRNLNEVGREQARAIGEAIRAAGVTIDEVLTSRWCRCVETAELLGLGEVRPFPALDSFFGDRSTGPRQTAELRDYLDGLDRDETVILVTHQVNITALTGEWVKSGEVFLLRIGEAGSVEIVDRVLIEP